MEQFYGTVKKLKLYTGIGVHSNDFDVEDENELDEILEEFLLDAKDYIDDYTERDFLQEEDVPRKIHSVAVRIASNLILYSQFNRQTRMKRLNEDGDVLEDRIMTKTILKDLDKYVKPDIQLSSYYVVGDKE